MGNIVAIVGRPNVGKSTFYNRLIGTREAIVDDVSGVTRDRKYGTTEWNGKKFIVVDTGGFVEGSDDVFEAAIRSQVRLAIDEASVIILMVDAMTGVTDLDEKVCEMLRRCEKPVILAVNKVDNPNLQLMANEFWSLGIEEVFFISSVSGSGSGDLLDSVAEKVEEYVPLETDLPKIAIVGQPNVGKSSFVNALLGEERNIVTDIAGTTRDPIHAHYNKFGKEFVIVDTAGMRRKAKVHEDLEFYSVMRAVNAIDECDVAVLMVDVNQGVTAQDLAIFKLAKDRHKGLVILANKWDLAEKDTNTARDIEMCQFCLSRLRINNALCRRSMLLLRSLRTVFKRLRHRCSTIGSKRYRQNTRLRPTAATSSRLNTSRSCRFIIRLLHCFVTTQSMYPTTTNGSWKTACATGSIFKVCLFLCFLEINKLFFVIKYSNYAFY